MMSCLGEGGFANIQDTISESAHQSETATRVTLLRIILPYLSCPKNDLFWHPIGAYNRCF